MSKVTLTDLTSLTNQTSAITIINQNMDDIVTAIENTLSRDGTSPNEMESDFDMNDNRILNLPEPLTDTEPLRLGDVDLTVNGALYLSGTSSTSNSVGTGSKTWVTQTSRLFTTGQYVTITTGSTTPLMYGQVTSYTGGSLTVNVTYSTGSGTYTDWDLFISAPPSSSSALSDGDYGDVTIASNVITVDNNAISNAKLAQVSTATFKGRTTAGTGNVEDLTATQATALLNVMVGDSGSGGTKGLVPAPTTGDSTKFLRGDGTFQTIAGGGDALTSGNLSQFAATTSAQLASVISDETGTGGLVFATSPTLVTPILGTPTSGTLTNCTGLPISTGVSGLGTGIATFLATPSSANLIAAVTNETGTGSLVFATSPTLVTPLLGTPTSGTLTNCTGLPISGLTASTSTALGVGSIELGHATDTTISRVSAGVVAIEGSNILTAATGQPLDADLTSWAAVTRAAGFDTFAATPSSANLATLITNETGSGSLVFGTSPTITTPVLTVNDSEFTLQDNLDTTKKLQFQLSGITTATTRTLTVPDASDTLVALAATQTLTNKTLTSPTLTTPVLGTPTSGTLTNCTGLPVATGISGLGTGVATFLATPSSANLAAALTDETGTGANVFATSPTLVTPILGTPTSGTLTNCTGLPIAGLVASTSTALGVGSIELGHATDTTISRVSAGVVAIEGSNILTAATGQPLDADLTSWAGVTRASGFDTFAATPSSANLAALVTNETGSGALVFGTSPTITTPTLTVLDTGLTIQDNADATKQAQFQLSSITTATTRTYTLPDVSDTFVTLGATQTLTSKTLTSPTLTTPVLGTPSSGTLTNCTGLPVSTGISGLGTGVATFLATPSSANLISAITDETGTGSLVFATSPTLVTPLLGTPTSGTLTNCTGLPTAGLVNNAVTNAKLAQVATATFKGRTTAGTGDVEDLTATQATALLNVMVGDSGSGGTKGLVPAPVSGDSTKFLRGDGTFQTIPGGGDALTSGNLSQFAATTSLQLAGVISDETGSGALVFATSPTLVTPALGTPSSGTLTNCTGLPVSGITASTSTALGVGSIELGHASDTTIARSSAGVATIEGVRIQTARVGEVIMWPLATAPTNTLACDGSAVSRTTYATLFGVIGSTYGAGDGTTTFNLPDYRGEFLRGFGSGTNDPDGASRTAHASGTATGNNIGARQSFALEAHTHTTGVSTTDNGGTSKAEGSSGATDNTPATSGVVGATTSSNETRPRNVTILFCIVYQ